MSHRVNMVPSIIEPLGAIPDVRGEQQEEEINLDLSVHAEDDPDNKASTIIGDGAAGLVEDVG
jgi:hypothetical protein